MIDVAFPPKQYLNEHIEPVHEEKKPNVTMLFSKKEILKGLLNQFMKEKRHSDLMIANFFLN